MNITSKTSQHDAYYWQNQQSLQQSALSFDAHLENSLPTPSSRDLFAGSIDVNADDMPMDPTDNLATKSLGQDDVDGSHYQHALISTLIQKSIDPANKSRDDESQINYQKSRVSTVNIPTANYRLLNQIPLTQYPLFKNHQIFIQNSQVELALNTKELSKNDINQLEKSIKQWLKDHQLQLKQLIINGVSK